MMDAVDDNSGHAEAGLDPAQMVACGSVTLATTGFAAFTLLLLAARLLGLSFTFVVSGAVVIGTTAIVIAARRLWMTRARWSRRHVVSLALLMTLMLGCGAWTLTVNAPEEDDSLYAAPSVQALAHPDRPMRVDLSWIVPFPNGAIPTLPLSVLFNNVEVLWACVSFITGIGFLTLYQGGGAFVFGAAFPLVYFVLLTRLQRSTRAALLGALAAAIAAVVLFREGGIGYGLVLNKIWIGKVILEAIVIPTVAGFAFHVARRPNLTRWGWLCASAIAATGCSSSGLSLGPSLLLALTPGAVWQVFSNEHIARAQRWLHAMAVPAAAVYPVAGGAYSYLFTKADQLAQHTIARPISNGDPQSSAEIFHTAFVTFFGTWHSLTSIVVLLAASAILAARAREHRPVICWGLATIVFFMNPWSAGFVARHLTSEMAYPRMFYVMPVFALTALAVADLSDRPTRRFTSALLAVAMIGAAGLYALWVGGAALPIDVPKLRVLGSARLGRPFVRMDPELRSDAREIDQILPAGNTLSAVDYELALSMTSTRLPQYGLWPIDIITFYGDVEGASADARLRHNAARFLIGIGQRELRADFEALLDTPVRNVVLSHRMVRDLSLMKTAVTGKGFTPIRETARYVLYTRPERDQ